ncbi:MAG: hypothetical protein AAF591_16000 [Verrucomicrobiota bacterium]
MPDQDVEAVVFVCLPRMDVGLGGRIGGLIRAELENRGVECRFEEMDGAVRFAGCDAWVDVELRDGNGNVFERRKDMLERCEGSGLRREGVKLEVVREAGGSGVVAGVVGEDWRRETARQWGVVLDDLASRLVGWSGEARRTRKVQKRKRKGYFQRLRKAFGDQRAAELGVYYRTAVDAAKDEVRRGGDETGARGDEGGGAELNPISKTGMGSVLKPKGLVMEPTILKEGAEGFGDATARGLNKEQYPVLEPTILEEGGETGGNAEERSGGAIRRIEAAEEAKPAKGERRRVRKERPEEKRGSAGDEEDDEEEEWEAVKTGIWPWVFGVSLVVVLGVVIGQLREGDADGRAGIRAANVAALERLGVALNLYAKEHEGRLPDSLDELGMGRGDGGMPEWRHDETGEVQAFLYFGGYDWDAPGATVVAAAPASYGDGKRAVLYLDSVVEHLPETIFDRRLRTGSIGGAGE